MQKKAEEKIENVERQDWNAGEIAEEAANKPEDEVMREMLRGDETKGDADNRDVAGSADFEDTPHGRKEAKKNNTEKKNDGQ